MNGDLESVTEKLALACLPREGNRDWHYLTRYVNALGELLNTDPSFGSRVRDLLGMSVREMVAYCQKDSCPDALDARLEQALSWLETALWHSEIATQGQCNALSIVTRTLRAARREHALAVSPQKITRKYLGEVAMLLRRRRWLSIPFVVVRKSRAFLVDAIVVELDDTSLEEYVEVVLCPGSRLGYRKIWTTGARIDSWPTTLYVPTDPERSLLFIAVDLPSGILGTEVITGSSFELAFGLAAHLACAHKSPVRDIAVGGMLSSDGRALHLSHEESHNLERKLANAECEGYRLIYAMSPESSVSIAHPRLIPAADFSQAASLYLGSSLGGEASGSSNSLMQLPPKEAWFHETTNDEVYLERDGLFSELDSTMSDQNIRVLSITGMGGLGKTSLIGHWLKVRKAHTSCGFVQLVYWSFYGSNDPDKFFKKVYEQLVPCDATASGITRRTGWLKRRLAKTRANARTDQARSQNVVTELLALLRSVPALIVLDGLEVRQERPGSRGYGKLVDPSLRDFLFQMCAAHTPNARRPSLLVLTSRFPFTDLLPFSHRSYRSIELGQLSQVAGALLLKRDGVGGSNVARQEISKRFEGHPLALRVFAATARSQVHGDPTQLCDRLLTPNALGSNENLERKLQNLLLFYENQLPPERVSVLSIVSLFRTPVRRDIVVRIAQTSKTIVEEDTVYRELNLLRRDHLIIEETPDGYSHYSCHPLIREHFRQFFGRDSRHVINTAVDLLMRERPAESGLAGLSDAQPILVAIELLLDIGAFQKADELFTAHFSNGQFFARIPAFEEGLACALNFIRSEERRALCGSSLKKYLNHAGVFALGSGDFDLAEQLLLNVIEMGAHYSDQATVLQTLSHLYLSRGQLYDAIATCRRSSQDAARCGNTDAFQISHLLNARLLCMTGRSKEVAQTATGMLRERPLPRGLAAIHLGEILRSIGRIGEAVFILVENLRYCEAVQSKASMVRTLLSLARARFAIGEVEEAASNLNSALGIARSGKQLIELVDIQIARAHVAMRRMDYDSADVCLEEALSLAIPRLMLCAQVDALSARAMLKSRTSKGSGHGRDRHEAEEIAHRIGYVGRLY